MDSFGLYVSCFYLFRFLFEYNYVLGPLLLRVGDTGTKGAIPGLRRIHSLVRETHESVVTVQPGKCWLSQRYVGKRCSRRPGEEPLASVGEKGVENC